MFLLVIVGPVYCIFQLQMEFAQENVFCTEIYSDTQLMQKYRDISLKGGFLPHATIYDRDTKMFSSSMKKGGLADSATLNVPYSPCFP